MFEDRISYCAVMVALLSGVPLGISSLVGLVAALFQSATQVQDQTITYTIKFTTMALVLIVFAPWSAGKIVQLLQEYLLIISAVGKS